MPEWSVAEPRKLTFEEPVRTLRVRVVNGTVNVVGTDEDSARLEVSEISGPPLTVTQHDGTLSVAYDDLPWKGFLEWLDPRGTRRRTVISLAVPAGTRVEVGAIGAGAVVTGIEGRTEVRGITGDTTLVGLTGPVRAETVSGNVAAQGVTGDLRFDSVSGDLTVFDGSGSSVRAESVSGAMIVDLDPATGSADVGLTSISGEIAVRLPHPAHAEVRADTASGSVSSDFDDLRVSGQWGAKKLTGKLGSGSGRLRAKTISGSISGSTSGSASRPVDLTERPQIVSRSSSRIDRLTNVEKVMAAPHPIDPRKTAKALGFEISESRHVTFDKKELDELRPKSTKAIEVTDFVALDEVDPIYYERTYWLGPDGEAAERPYRLLLAAMEDEGKAGIGTVVMRKKQYLAAIRPLDGALAMSTMRFADEVVPQKDIDALPGKGAKPDPKELKLASQIIGSLATEWDPTRYHDTYTEELKRLIEAKAKGKEIVAPEEPEAPPA